MSKLTTQITILFIVAITQATSMPPTLTNDGINDPESGSLHAGVNKVKQKPVALIAGAVIGGIVGIWLLLAFVIALCTEGDVPFYKKLEDGLNWLCYCCCRGGDGGGCVCCCGYCVCRWRGMLQLWYFMCGNYASDSIVAWLICGFPTRMWGE